jgi:hypothetical protein
MNKDDTSHLELHPGILRVVMKIQDEESRGCNIKSTGLHVSFAWHNIPDGPVLSTRIRLADRPSRTQHSAAFVKCARQLPPSISVL